MLYCPKCNALYRDGFTHCADCKAELCVGPIPPPDTPDEDIAVDLGEPAYLCTTDNGMETGALISLLKDMGIPTLLKRNIPGVGMSINTYTRTEQIACKIYVPESQLELARELINAPDETEPDHEFDRLVNKKINTRRLLAWIFAALMLSGVLFSVIMLIRNFLAG